MNKNILYGILFGASASFWWGIIGVFYFKETVNVFKVVCIILVVIGVVGLRMFGVSDGVSN